MEFPRLSSPPSIHVHDFNNSYDRRMSTVNSSSHPVGEQSFSSPGPMRIPTKNVQDFAPPPLPPPPHINALQSGHDAGWIHANSPGFGSFGKLTPIDPGSSLYGGHSRPEPLARSDRSMVSELERTSGTPLSKSPQPPIKIDLPHRTDEGFRGSVSSSMPGPILEGERDFSRKSVKSSSDAYDQHLLSKIGKPHSPSRHPGPLGIDGRNSLTALPFHPRSAGTLPSPGAPDGPGGSLELRWYNNSSGGISPGTKLGWKDYMDCRSPSVESNAPFGLDFENAARRSAGGVTPQSEDTFSLPSRSNRGSYDQGVFSDVEGDFSAEDSTQYRQGPLGERTPPYLDGASTQYKQQGMKRRASTSNGDRQRRTTEHPFTNSTSPNSRYQVCPGSLSSASSASLRTGSYASSAGLSLGGSSVTSISSYDRLSPGGISPGSEFEQYHEKTILNPSPPASLIGQPAARGAQYCAVSEAQNAATARKMSVQTTLNVSKPTGPGIQGMFICDCCPKKPKKFSSPEELRAHESEKQYSCQFCNNRFKNKNEAERHQNSLHLRRHSWSCAALSGYQAAFHSSISPAAQTSAGPSHDTCGYCGEDFPNFPQPDWDRRFEHLTSVHKFGECNNAKKFYRADHFRQHLKHSHAGTSGKWTNILENACMKDEPQAESRLGSISEQGGRGPSSVNGAGTTVSSTGTLSSNTIDEVMDES
ncbi:hypothetical protein DTO166G4_8559 [Paecilomyces variotii]|nr:hypothetical protein DTO166G4_8559 [Paecilomyces variotii]KAJ9229087.1 hypothetical protein DTO166G5_8169 [Paecilomyces variotii]KAJ9270966.1 hypothetical protein DTO212C5_2911 [Paecilomyces variotii]